MKPALSTLCIDSNDKEVDKAFVLTQLLSGTCLPIMTAFLTVGVLLSFYKEQEPLTTHWLPDASQALTHLVIASVLVSSTFLYRRLKKRTSPSQSPLCLAQTDFKRHANTMTQLTPILSRKRIFPDAGSGTRVCNTQPTKRQRSISKNALPTPPASAKGTATMALKLIIPQEEPGQEQQKKASRHRADAERWKPKLQRPFPRKTEIKQAYALKLMRQYPNTPGEIETNFFKPKIERSPRVSRLLQQFPLVDTNQPVRSKEARLPNSCTPIDLAKPLSSRLEELIEARNMHTGLQANIHITESEHAQRLAWQAFSRTEQDRIDRGREAMMESGLPTDDLEREYFGQWNTLPDWKKSNTGRFAREHGAS
ncbi:hypothetical protein EKO04_004809 [Ascochyta lentis]|uniref:Uncharacterized protein n=1 Tax=Ascochyta lentis TaxID=205686 RepID=A0A8H7J5X2_9PLEO|nr:hypothetical protein EKO04_004809 [Ascochyta lentis]